MLEEYNTHHENEYILTINFLSEVFVEVVVFHCRPKAPTYATPSKTLHKLSLRSSSRGSSFPNVFTKSVPFAAVSQDGRKGQLESRRFCCGSLPSPY